jgi:N-dimethylarginine dimethylaminohydrolase
MSYVPEKNDSNKKRANKWEKKLAKKFGMKQTISSGSGVWEKGDLKSVEFVGESKKTQQDSISLRREWLEKIQIEAKNKNKEWFVHIGFTDLYDKELINAVVISEKMFKMLIDITKSSNESGDKNVKQVL